VSQAFSRVRSSSSGFGNGGSAIVGSNVSSGSSQPSSVKKLFSSGVSSKSRGKYIPRGSRLKSVSYGSKTSKKQGIPVPIDFSKHVYKTTTKKQIKIKDMENMLKEQYRFRKFNIPSLKKILKEVNL
jgi:hypothetical protein